jgi:hypothetical protein
VAKSAPGRAGVISPEALQVAQAVISSALLGLSAVGVPLALASAWRYFRDGGPRPGASGGPGLGVPGPAGPREDHVGARARNLPRPALLVLAAFLLGALLRLVLVPHHLATVFIGYQRAAEAIALVPFAHYGVGSSALYHAVFQLFAPDHRTMMAVNAVCATLTLPLLATFAARLFRDPLTGALTALLVALTPLFVRNDTSDANILPCLLWTFAGLTLWLDHLDTRRLLPLAGATALLALAATGRPELPAVIPALLFASTYLHPRGLRALLAPPSLAAAAAFAALITPHLLHIAYAIGWLAASDSLPGASAQRLTDLPTLFVTRNLLARPTLYPVALSLLALAALAIRRPEGRAPARVTLALTALMLVAYAVDLDESNIARVHVPAALTATILAASTLSWLHSKRLGRIYLLAALTVTALTAAPTAARLFAPTNEAQEERLIDALPAMLPADTPYVLVTRGQDDWSRETPDARYTHLYFPSYLFSPPRAPGEVQTISDFLREPTWDRPVFFYQGFRCYADFRRASGPPPPGDDLRPHCRAFRDAFALEPVAERDLPNRGDVWIPYYGDAPTLRVGLYRVRPRPDP